MDLITTKELEPNSSEARKHLCKAKTFDGKWVYGYFFYVSEVNRYFIMNNIAIKNDNDNGYSAKTYIVDPETVCRYTGVSDTFDVMFFEGDIVLCGEFVDGLPTRYIIEYCDDDMSWILNDIHGCESFAMSEINPDKLSMYGNIHNDGDWE